MSFNANPRAFVRGFYKAPQLRYSHQFMTRSKPRTLCPYTKKLLAECPSTSVEHIIPDSIGGPTSYSVRADKNENSWFGSNVDKFLVDSHFVRLMRTMLKIRGRNGVPDLRLKGRTKENQDPVRVTIFPDGSSTSTYEKPLQLDESTGKGRLIVSPEDAQQEIKRLTERYAKSDRQVTYAEPTSLNAQPVEAELKLSLYEIKAGILKIAYLAAFEFLGDIILQDPLNDEWQKGIRYTTPEERAGIQLPGECPCVNHSALKVFLPPLQHHEHAISIFCLNRTPMVVVKLFGWDLLTCLCPLSVTSDFGMGQGEGKVIKCDAKTRKIEECSWMDHLQITAP